MLLGYTIYGVTYLNFFQTQDTANRLFRSVEADLCVPELIAGCKALGLIDKLVTGPLWRILEDSTTSIQPLSKRSKTYTTVADPGSTSGGTFQSMQIFAVFIYFFIPVVSRSSFTSRTPNKNQKIEQLFYSIFFKSHNPETFMSSAASAFVHATLKRSQKVPRAKSGTFRFPRMDSHDSSTIP